MVTLEQLYELACSYKIKILYDDLHGKQHQGIDGYADAGKNLIVLDVSLLDNHRHHKCVLAEEIGHILFPPRLGHIAYHMNGYYELDHYDRSYIKAIVAQDKRKALLWATSVLIPNVELCRIINEDIMESVYDYAEYFDVEKWFMVLRLNYYKRQNRENGRKTKWKDIIKRK